MDTWNKVCPALQGTEHSFPSATALPKPCSSLPASSKPIFPWDPTSAGIGAQRSLCGVGDGTDPSPPVYRCVSDVPRIQMCLRCPQGTDVSQMCLQGTDVWCLSLCSQPITCSGDSTVLQSPAVGCELVLTTQARQLGCALPRAGVSSPVRDLSSLPEVLRGAVSRSGAGGRLPSAFIAGRKGSVLVLRSRGFPVLGMPGHCGAARLCWVVSLLCTHQQGKSLKKQ